MWQRVRVAKSLVLLGALAGLAIFALIFVVEQNLAFNLDGFRAHFVRIVGPEGPGGYRMFAATWHGFLSVVERVPAARSVEPRDGR